MRFLVDMPLSPALSEWLTEHGHDAIHASRAGLAKDSDEAIIQRARIEKRVIVTADLDYPRLLALRRATEPGLILFRGGRYSEQEIVARLSRVLDLVPHDELGDSVVIVEPAKIRRHRMPIR